MIKPEPNIDNINKLLHYGADPTIYDNGGILWLIKTNKLHIIKTLAEKGINMTFDDNHPLRYACQWGYELMVKYLIEHCRADINCQEGKPLLLTVINNHYDLMIYLLNNGADKILSKRALSSARYYNRQNLIPCLLNYGISDEVSEMEKLKI